VGLVGLTSGQQWIELAMDEETLDSDPWLVKIGRV